MGSMKKQLPDMPASLPRVKWTSNKGTLARVKRVGYKHAPFGKVKRLRGDLHVLDSCYTRDGDLHSVKIALINDHPFLAYLNGLKHVPRAVKAMYRKEVRLAHLMASQSWDHGRMFYAAHDAWDGYRERMA